MAEKVHMCETCGKTTDKLGHLCDPVEVDEAYVCDHCGQASTDPRHICKPKLQNINFVCIACGRVAELPSQLCNPRDIELMKKQDPPTKITQLGIWRAYDFNTSPEYGFEGVLPFAGAAG